MTAAKLFKMTGVGEVLVIIFPDDVTISELDLEGGGMASKRVAFESDDALDVMLVVVS